MCGGKIDFRTLPLGTNNSLAMVPVNGKPVIAWILDDLLAKGIKQATVVLPKQDDHFHKFLLRVYAPRMDLSCVPVEGAGTILTSLNMGMEARPGSQMVRVILGDTLIRDSYTNKQDFVYVSKVETSQRWCLAQVAEDQTIVAYEDKIATAPENPALAGYYHFCDGPLLQECLNDALKKNERELSSVLLRYGGKNPIKAVWVKEWFDFGHIDGLVDARRRLLRPRYFNLLEVNPILNTIRKSSEHDAKLRDELDWFLEIPDELKVLTPRIVSHRHVNGRLNIVQEYYGYPTLAELYIYSDLPPDAWQSILRRVFRVHAEFCRFKGDMPADLLGEMYGRKTWDRLNTLRKQDPRWNLLLDAPGIHFNGEQLKGINELKPQLEKKVAAISKNPPVTVIHGDFCFSNILFDVNNQILRLIDPRGSFGGKGIYGDPRYDVAKLRHSVSGLYDFVVADMFSLKEEGTKIETRIFADSVPFEVVKSLDALIVEAGYDLEEIRLIEGLLFISMLPLHQDHPKRQSHMFGYGLKLLNEVVL